jgi:D-alanyl-D-alanine carboxypeptidase
MNKIIQKYSTDTKIRLIINILGIVAVLAFAYFLYSLSSDVRDIKSELAQTNQKFGQKIALLEADLATTTRTSDDLAQKLAEQQNQSEDLNDTLSDIASTVGTLEKLSKTDRELLQKYSKVYFLNENYVPTRLSPIDDKYSQDKTKSLQFHGLVLPYLNRMLNAAEDDGVTIQVASAYRSFGTQAALKYTYLVSYGTGANKFSSDQGFSEHQLGTTVDLSAPNTSTLLSTSFESTDAFKWLNENAYKYGFILSYPKNNAYYQYEPWHWRFVGVNLAKYLHSKNKNFYDLDQRQIDGYLAKIFD